jgi:hypothetical protein
LNFFSHPRVSFFFTRIGSQPYQNFGEKKIENFFWDIQEGHSFSPELVGDLTKILGKEKKIEKKVLKIFF